MSERAGGTGTRDPAGTPGEAGAPGQDGTPEHVLDRVYEVVRQRQAAGDAKSYVATLTARGLPKVRSKVLEEAGELLEASVRLEAEDALAEAEGRADEAGVEALVHEAADLVFHLLVLLGAQDVPAEAVWAELERRFGVGGLVEKSARGAKRP